jgi:hypothetical protein
MTEQVGGPVGTGPARYFTEAETHLREADHLTVMAATARQQGDLDMGAVRLSEAAVQAMIGNGWAALAGAAAAAQ